MIVSGSAVARPVYGRIIGQCTVSLWGLSSEERLHRQLRGLGITRFLADHESPPEDSTVLLLRADWLYDQRTLRDLVAAPGTLLKHSGKARGGRLLAGHVPASRLDEVEAALGQNKPAPRLSGLERKSADELSAAYQQKLLKTERPVVLEIKPERRELLERHLFDGSYKGITDLVTKWVWPAPARGVVRLCVRFGIRPNAVTLTSLVLVFAVLGLFSTGWLGLGLPLAWIMTFLDTVDGKLARVTVDDSALGHALDKGIDLVHPPLWYIAWGVGAAGVTLADGLPVELWGLSALVLAGYIGGRLLEGAFDFYLGKFPIYSWRPLDAYVRLIIARRNPNLLLLSVAWMMGRSGEGLRVVAGWTAISTIFLAGRLVWAAYCRATGGPLKSWLQQASIDPQPGLAARTFANGGARLSHALESSG